MYKQWASKCDGGWGGAGPGPATVVGDVHFSPSAEERHVRRQAAGAGAAGDVRVGDGDPVTVDHQPQVGLQARVGRLGGEEELVDSFNGSLEHSGPPVEASAHVHQNLTVLDPVHLAKELAGVRGKEVDLFGRPWEKEETLLILILLVIEREMEDSESSTNFSQSLYHILSFSCNLSSNLMESQYKMAGDT